MKWLPKEWILKHKAVSVVLTLLGIIFGASFFIQILNVQSYPFVGNPWTTDFTTVGKGNLKITPFNGTLFEKDLEFTSLKCGDRIVEPTELTDLHVKFDNYYCFSESHFEVKVLSSGVHTLRFEFGSEVDYSYNNATLEESWSIISLEGDSFNGLDVIVKDVNKTSVTLYYWGREGSIEVSIPEFMLEKPTKVDKNTINNDSLVQTMFGGTLVKYYIPENQSNVFEFEIEIEKYPKLNGNVFTFLIENYTDLNFYYQPPLNLTNSSCNETDCDGSHRPENVVGSYAVYSSTKRDNQYTTGKVFHIYRPKVIAKDGSWIWGVLDFKDENLTVTVDNDWLLKAKYPVVIDPSFGYGILGESDTEFANRISGSNFTCPESGVIADSLTVGLENKYGGSITRRVGVAIYSGTTLVDYIKTGNFLTIPVGSSWIKQDFSNNTELLNIEYYLVAWAQLSGIYIDYDTGISAGAYNVSEYDVEGFIDPWTPIIEDRLYSIYVNYTVPDTTPPTYLDNSTNSTIAGEDVLHNLKYTDETGLATTGGYIFSFDNGTGTLVNNSWIAFSTNPDWSNVTKTVNSTAGANIKWCVYANDTSNNWNNTGCVTPFSYITTELDTTLPTYSNSHQSVTNNTNVSVGQSITFGAQWNDNIALSMYMNSTSINESSFTNGTWQSFTAGNWSNFTISYPSTAQGGNFTVKIYANDTSNNWNNTGEWFWKNETAEAPPSDTCNPTSPLTEDYTFDCNDNCTQLGTLNANGYEVIWNNAGNFYLEADIENIKNMTKAFVCNFYKGKGNITIMKN